MKVRQPLLFDDFVANDAKNGAFPDAYLSARRCDTGKLAEVRAGGCEANATLIRSDDEVTDKVRKMELVRAGKVAFAPQFRF